MDFEVIAVPNASLTVGPYSHATRAGDFIFVSGQAALDPKTGRLIEGGIREQTSQVLRNISAILEAAGSDLSRVVKVTVFLHDWKYFQGMNETYAEFFDFDGPTRTTVAVKELPHPHQRLMVRAVAHTVVEDPLA